MKNIQLHVGIHKTATTSIQETLFTNKVLPKYMHQYYYPKSWSSNHGSVLLKLSDAHYNLPYLVLKEQNHYINKLHKINMLNEVASISADTLVISAEILCVASEETLEMVKKYFESIYESVNISIMIYVRNPVSHFTSTFQQATKTIFYCAKNDLEMFVELYCNEKNPLQKFIHIFGQENIKVVRFEHTLTHPFGPVGYFYEKCLHVAPNDLKNIQFKKCNESMSQIATDMCLFINQKIPMHNKNRTGFSNERRLNDLDVIAKCISGEKYKLSKQERLNLLNQCGNLLRHLKDTFDIDYLTEDMRQAILMDTEPNHEPSCQNITEIKRIFYQLDFNIQEGLIHYLREINNIYCGDAQQYIEITQLIHQLEKKQKKWSHKIMTIVMKQYRKLRNLYTLSVPFLYYVRFKIKRLTT
ncbi:MAG: hypothetical protein Q8R24_02835 [Legionellaceae bacterium]|nr:hypothetical protein [Legionellaceae bacterium]